LGGLILASLAMPIFLVQNYRVAKKGLDDRFGYGNYVAMQQAPLEDIVEALRPGGLSNVKGEQGTRIGFVF
jgi:hypothetical protein